jgi:mRNA interferase MazF
VSKLARPWQVWVADLNPTAGGEQRRRRPFVVVSSSLYCAFPIPMVIVVPLTTVDRGLPHHIPILSASSGLDRPSWARTDDIRAISEQRFISRRPLGVLSPGERDAVRAQLLLMIDISDPAGHQSSVK